MGPIVVEDGVKKGILFWLPFVESKYPNPLCA